MLHNLVCGRCWTAIRLVEPHGNGRHFVNVGYRLEGRGPQQEDGKARSKE
jgi:hypothetical protein